MMNFWKRLKRALRDLVVYDNVHNIINHSNVSIMNNRVRIGNKTIDVPKGSISIIGNRVYVDGKEIDIGDNALKYASTVNVFIEGNVGRIDCNGSVTIKGDVYRGFICGGSADIDGNSMGDIDAGGPVRIGGNSKGDIDAGGSVSVRSRN